MSGTYENKRTRAREKYFDRLLLENGYFCHYCKKEIVRLKEIQKEFQIVKVDWQEVTWINHQQQVKRARIATIDHIKPLSKGGTNHFSNLIQACAYCNLKKNSRPRSEKNQQIKKETKTIGRARYWERQGRPDDERELGEAGA